ncbi:MAG: NAD(P)-dependent oxidoreductase [Oscillospiraceae bacterium]|nr:NAD(P)-dependent oxidoreductase [Oscillospiraceae bacterium]
MKKVIVTGAGGFIGRSLVNKLSAENTVYAILYSESEKALLTPSENVITIIGDLNDWEKIAEQIVTDEKIDVFYHLAWGGISAAAYKDIDIQKENISMSINCALLAKQIGCRKFVFVGTNQEYLKGAAYDNTVSNASVYGVCKMCARNLCNVVLKDTMEFNSTAFTNVFGKGDFSNRTANFFISKLLKGESLDLIEGNNKYDWTYIDDAVEGLIAVGTKGINGKQYYIGSREIPTFKEIIIKLRDIICPEAQLNLGKYNDPTYTDYSNFDLDALFNDTGFECKADVKESVLKTVDWLKNREIGQTAQLEKTSNRGNYPLISSFSPLFERKAAV